MKKIILIVSFALFLIKMSSAQSQQSDIFKTYEGKASEKVYVSRNTSILFTGEYLYYTVFCINDKTKQPSKISSLAYVMMVSEDGEVIFEQKVGLRDSRGYGDFFVPTTIPSGNYKLIAYTQWMRNGNRALFFEDDISIINPYRSNQLSILDAETAALNRPDVSYYAPPEKDRRFILETDSSSYSQRSKVRLKIKNFRGAAGYGNYTLSVRKKSGFQTGVLNHNPFSYLKLHEEMAKRDVPKYNNVRYLPEELGERIIGKVVSKGQNISSTDRKVAISIPGEDFQLLAAITDKNGFFYADVLKPYTQTLIIAQLLDEDIEDLEIEITKAPIISLENLKFQKFNISSELKETIEERSVHNQIENAFYQVKPDSLKLEDPNDPFLGSAIEEFDLDDYTRFPTLMETMIEILPYASIKKNGNKGSTFYVRLFESQEGEQLSALVFIDGVLVGDYEEIVEFDASKIQKISIIRDKFEIAGNNYRGMINIQTISKNYFDTASFNNSVKGDLIPMESRKNYFSQQYNLGSKERDKRIPDYRHQLLWRPDIYFTGKERNFEFYTSDVPGTYEIILEGFSIYGRPVVLRETFIVN